MAIRKRENKVEVPAEPNEVPSEVTQEEETAEEKTAEERVQTREVTVKKEATPPAVLADVAPSLASLDRYFDPVKYSGVFPKIVGSNGSILADNLSLGEFIDVQVVSISPRWSVTPKAKQTDKAAKKLCRYSFDGKTIPDRDGGSSMDITDWIKEIEATPDADNSGKNYKANSVQRYLDVFCLIFNADKNSDKAMDLDIVQVQISPSAVSTLERLIIQTKITIKRGRMLPSHQNCIRIEAEAHTGDISYTLLKATVVPVGEVVDYTPINMDEE